MKKKVLIILVIVIVLLLVIYGVIFLIDYNNISQGKLPIFAIKSDTENSDNNKDIVIIQDGKIQNENLLNDFIEKANNKETAALQVNNILNENTETIKLEYVAGENAINNIISENVTVTSNVLSKEATTEDYQKHYGYYKMTKNDKEEKFDDLHWEVKRKTTENTVQVIFYGYLLELTEIPVICEYDLDSSLYQKNYDLTYVQRKDMGVKQIAKINQFDNNDFDVL